MRPPLVVSTLFALVAVLLVPVQSKVVPPGAPTFMAPPVEAVPVQAAAKGSTPDARLVYLNMAWREGAESEGVRITEPIKLPSGTMLVGADWGGQDGGGQDGGGQDGGGQDGGTVEVRSRRDNVWSDWIGVEYDPLEGPDRGTAEVGSTWSDPVLVGRADAVQFWTDHPFLVARAVVIEYDTSPSMVTAATTTGGSNVLAAPASESPSESPSLSASDAPSEPDVAADARGSQPPIVTRAQWGADESLRDPRGPTYSPTVRFGVVHHTAGSNDYTAAESAGVVRGIYEYHTVAKGWWDIGYNFLIDRYGQVFEGRFGGLDRAVIGAHASGFNAGSVGISVMGNYTDTPLPAVARTSLEQLLAYKFTVHHVDPQATVTEVAGSGSRFQSGEPATFPRLVGHRQLGYTVCPGSIYDLIEGGEMAASVRARMGPTIATDSPDQLEVEIVGPPTQVIARTSRAATWRLDVRSFAGQTVRTVTWSAGREVTAEWDHRDADGRWAPAGDYDMVLSATLDNGAVVPPITVAVSMGPRVPLVGDWNGDGQLQPGMWRGGRWSLDDGADGLIEFSYGRPQDAPIVGNWDGKPGDEIGIIRDREWHLRFALAGGDADEVFTYGRMTRGDKPLVGDWNGDGRDEIGIVRDREWHLRNSRSGGPADTMFVYGRVTQGDVPVIGDWDGNGSDEVGIVRGGEWHLRFALAGGPADTMFVYGRVTQGDVPVVGDWDNADGVGVGVVRSTTWLLRDQLSGGPANKTWEFSGK